ncbi:hypothetical protein ACTVCO_05410 [Sanguibacter sp. A247]|uniref:hypothetical protein n=1 Tax=unclassified Sanguibacter TaxID=2645534 RepID=UPI003FD8A388
MHRTLGGTIAVLHGGSAALLLGPALRQSSDIEFFGLNTPVESLHHDHVLVGLADAIADGGAVLRTLAASREGVLVTFTSHDLQTANGRFLEGGEFAGVTSPSGDAPESGRQALQDVLEQALDGLDAARVLTAEGIRLVLVDTTPGAGNLASYAWLELTSVELDQEQSDASTELALLEDADLELDEPVAELASEPPARGPRKRRNRLRRRLKLTLRRLTRNKFVLIGSGLGLSAGMAAAGIAVEGHIVAGFLWGSVVALQSAMLYLIVRLRSFLLSQAGATRKSAKRTADDLAFAKTQRGNLMRVLGAVQREQTHARTLNTMTLEAIDEMRRK